MHTWNVSHYFLTLILTVHRTIITLNVLCFIFLLNWYLKKRQHGGINYECSWNLLLFLFFSLSTTSFSHFPHLSRISRSLTQFCPLFSVHYLLPFHLTHTLCSRFKWIFLYYYIETIACRAINFPTKLFILIRYWSCGGLFFCMVFIFFLSSIHIRLRASHKHTP